MVIVRKTDSRYVLLLAVPRCCSWGCLWVRGCMYTRWSFHSNARWVHLIASLVIASLAIAYQSLVTIAHSARLPAYPVYYASQPKQLVLRWFLRAIVHSGLEFPAYTHVCVGVKMVFPKQRA